MTKIVLSVALCLAVFGGLARSQSCPEKTGRFAVSGQCDAYIECVDGKAEQKLCDDGLLFNDKASPFAFPCSYPIDVDCGNRGRSQPAQPTDECPHQFGYFRQGDSSHCGQFLNCVNGHGFEFDCPEGLAFNKATYKCDWPDLVEDCDAEKFLNFRCPDIAKSPLLGDEETRFYPSPNNCHQFFSCHEGKPRLQNCGEDRAFNTETAACDDIENVRSCSGGKSAALKQAPKQAPKTTTKSSSRNFGTTKPTPKSKFIIAEPLKKRPQSANNVYRGQQKSGKLQQQSSRGGNTFSQSGFQKTTPKPFQSTFGQSSFQRTTPKPFQSTFGQSSFQKTTSKPFQSTFGQSSFQQKPFQSGFQQTTSKPFQSAFQKSSFQQKTTSKPFQSTFGQSSFQKTTSKPFQSSFQQQTTSKPFQKSTFQQSSFQKTTSKPFQSTFGQSSFQKTTPKPFQSTFGQSSFQKSSFQQTTPKPFQSTFQKSSFQQPTQKPFQSAFQQTTKKPFQSAFQQTTPNKPFQSTFQSAFQQTTPKPAFQLKSVTNTNRGQANAFQQTGQNSVFQIQQSKPFQSSFQSSFQQQPSASRGSVNYQNSSFKKF